MVLREELAHACVPQACFILRVSLFFSHLQSFFPAEFLLEFCVDKNNTSHHYP